MLQADPFDLRTNPRDPFPRRPHNSRRLPTTLGPFVEPFLYGWHNKEGRACAVLQRVWARERGREMATRNDGAQRQMVWKSVL